MRARAQPVYVAHRSWLQVELWDTVEVAKQNQSGFSSGGSPRADPLLLVARGSEPRVSGRPGLLCHVLCGIVQKIRQVSPVTVDPVCMYSRMQGLGCAYYSVACAVMLQATYSPQAEWQYDPQSTAVDAQGALLLSPYQQVSVRASAKSMSARDGRWYLTLQNVALWMNEPLQYHLRVRRTQDRLWLWPSP
jgi:hypothetical protein